MGPLDAAQLAPDLRCSGGLDLPILRGVPLTGEHPFGQGQRHFQLLEARSAAEQGQILGDAHRIEGASHVDLNAGEADDDRGTPAAV
jgi:hypothetical protein